MAFIETPRFPDSISYGSGGGPEYNTTVVGLGSGYEQRIRNWDHPLHKYNVGMGIKLLTDLEVVLQYYHVVAGRFDGFRFKDFTDFSSAGLGNTITNLDQNIGTGDSTDGVDGNGVFDLTKLYTFGATQYTRPIYKPVQGTLVVAVAGIAQTEGGGGDYTVDYTNGRITFNSGDHPLTGQAVTAGFEFDVPVRFDDDMLDISHEFFNAGTLSVILKELRMSR